MKRFLLYIFFFCILSLYGYAQEIERIEPPCWWANMNTELQIMLYGKDLKDADIKVIESGMSVKAIHNAESPNYLFIDMAIDKPGKYTLQINKKNKKTHINYEILSRNKKPESRKGLSTSDAIYLIMPDRFANGDSLNDHVNGSSQILDRKKLDARHGGDIQGIIDHLDYIADLGITALWSTPLLEDNLFYHHYAISDYYKIDPHFGDNESYKEMVTKAHSKGLKIIQDIVPNHCGAGHWWMKDLPFRNWINNFDSFTQSNYALQTFSDPHAAKADRELCARGWFVECLPDMNLTNPYTLQYLSQMTIWWIEYADLDALRIDTYFYMGHPGSKWTQNILKEYPQMKFIGEVWGNDPSIISYWIGDSPKYDRFISHLPMAMDFPLERALVMGLSNENEAWGGGVKAIYNIIAQDFLYGDAYNSLVVFADNHDIDRIYNMLGKDINKVKTAITIVSTIRGIPQIYYGTELLFENDLRGSDHKCRMDFPSGWKNDSINLFQPQDRTVLQQEMFNHVRTLLHFRKETPVVYNGKLMHYVPENDVYTYFRYNDSECLMVVINGSSKVQNIDWKRFEERLSGKSIGKDILSNKMITKGDNIKIEGNCSMLIYFK